MHIPMYTTHPMLVHHRHVDDVDIVLHTERKLQHILQQTTDVVVRRRLICRFCVDVGTRLKRAESNHVRIVLRRVLDVYGNMPYVSQGAYK